MHARLNMVRMRIIQTGDNRQYYAPTKKENINAINAGSLVCTGICLTPSLLLSDKITDKIWDINAKSDTVVIHKAMQKALKDSKLPEKGLNLITYNPKKAKSFNEIIGDYLDKLFTEKNPKEVLKHPLKSINDVIIETVKYGHNAGFDNHTNTIHINPKKMGTTFFHELGHAINHNTSPLWKAMQKTRIPLLITGSILPIVALVKRPKAPEEKPANIFDKTTTFIKENVGKLTAFSLVPVIAEELKATQRGNKIAKNLLEPALYKKVVNSNRLGAITYISTAFISGFGAYLGNVVRDKIAHPKEIIK